jgi:hypothetical protein
VTEIVHADHVDQPLVLLDQVAALVLNVHRFVVTLVLRADSAVMLVLKGAATVLVNHVVAAVAVAVLCRPLTSHNTSTKTQ